MKQPLFTINSTFSEEEVVRFNKYVILHMFHYVRNVVICNIILLLFTVGMIVNDITSEDFPIGSIMMFLLIIIVNWSLYKSPIQKARTYPPLTSERKQLISAGGFTTFSVPSF